VTYLPDFKVTERDGSVVYHEVKGWMDSQSKSKLKRMAKFYPEVRVIVVDEDGYKAIARSVAPIVPYWGEPLVSKEKLDAE
jgi:predicted nuclease of restriction endonuclease-like RecB superfamily